MRLKYRISLMVIAILMVMSLFVGSSYALWRLTDYQQTTNLIESGCFSISFNDKEGKNSINLDNAYPEEDTKGMSRVPYEFTIKNTCTVDAKVTIYLSSLNVDNKLDDKYIRYAMYPKNGALKVAKSLVKYGANDDSIIATKNLDTSHFNLEREIEDSYILEEEVLLAGASSDTASDGGEATYNLNLWINNKAEKNIAGKTFEAAITTIARPTKINNTPTVPTTPEPTPETDDSNETEGV